MIGPLLLTVAEVLEIYSEQLHAHGGIHSISDRSLLESAVMTPQSSFGGKYLHSDLFKMAARMLSHYGKSAVFKRK